MSNYTVNSQFSSLMLKNKNKFLNSFLNKIKNRRLNHFEKDLCSDP